MRVLVVRVRQVVVRVFDRFVGVRVTVGVSVLVGVGWVVQVAVGVSVLVGVRVLVGRGVNVKTGGGGVPTMVMLLRMVRAFCE